VAGLGDLAGGDFNSLASGVSADGSVVVGTGTSASGGEAFRWTSGGGMVGLGDLAGGSFSSNANDVSADGVVVVGESQSASGKEAFRWTAGAGMVGLGDLAGGSFSSTATAVSAEGRWVVGSGTSASGQRAFIWDKANGMRALDQVLLARGIDLTGWTLKEATGISADGTIIVGYGVHAGFGNEAWMADLSGPTDPPAAPFGPVTGIGTALALGGLGYTALMHATKRRPA
jgi:probable HAF family extracellular repeat protein